MEITNLPITILEDEVSERINGGSSQSLSIPTSSLPAWRPNNCAADGPGCQMYNPSPNIPSYHPEKKIPLARVCGVSG